MLNTETIAKQQQQKHCVVLPKSGRRGVHFAAATDLSR